MPAWAQYDFLNNLQPEAPQPFRWNFDSGALGLYSEGVSEKDTYGGSSSENYTRLFIGPELQLGLDGSIYHPNLARFSLTMDGALGQSWQQTGSGGTSASTQQLEYLGNLHTTLSLLNNKPYASTIMAGVTHSFQEYDFFNQTTVDTRSYGFRTGYQDGPVPFNINYQHLDETETGLNENSTTVQDTLNLTAGWAHPFGATQFSYGLTDFSQSSNGGGASTGLGQNVGLNDTETFGGRQQMTLNSDLGYSWEDSGGSPNDNLNADSHLNVQHTPNLSTYYDMSYSRTTSGPDVADYYNVDSGVRHQLYESLSSDLEGYAQRSDVTGPDGASDTTEFGVSLSEGYSKQLNADTHLSISASGGIDHTEVDQSGSEVPVIDEPDTFQASMGDTFPLKQPDVITSSIQIYSDTLHTKQYVEGTDYTVSQNGQLTYITRLTGVSTIPQGATVYVSYNYNTMPSGSYDTDSEGLQVRLDFFNGLLGVYGNANLVQNNASAGLVVQDITAYAAGADVSWRFLRAGAEYQIYDSTFSSYRAARLYETMNFAPDTESSLSFSFAQSWTTYLDNGLSEAVYSFINHYHRRLTRNWGFDLEDGISLTSGTGVDQTVATVRPELEFAIGKFSLKVSYEMEYQEYLSTQEMFQQTFSLRAMRSF
jgi:hypothetical protein